MRAQGAAKPPQARLRAAHGLPRKYHFKSSLTSNRVVTEYFTRNTSTRQKIKRAIKKNARKYTIDQGIYMRIRFRPNNLGESVKSPSGKVLGS